MSAPTYTVSALVLRKTKLGEGDLILSLLAQDGSQIRAVAKGARKPRSSFASRLELYSAVDLLCVRGKSLDIVKEARLIEGHERLRSSVEHAAGAACMAELLERVTQADLADPKLFACTQVALASLARADVDQVPLVTAAHLLKTLSFAGLRPHLSSCVFCGSPADFATPDGLSCEVTPPVRLSFQDGGYVCPACAPHAQTYPASRAICAWALVLMRSTFAEIERMSAPLSTGLELLQLCQQWTREHIGSNLKSIRFLLTAGLF